MTTTVPGSYGALEAQRDESGPRGSADATASLPTVSTSLLINGQLVEVDVEPRRSLSDVLRRETGLTGTTVGCEQGSCGTCTVLLDGAPVRSCIVLAAQATEKKVETVESLGQGGRLSRLQEEFRRHGALQCGFCTPGFLMIATEFLRRHPRPTRSEVTREMAGNLCRCTGYEPIIDAVLASVDADSGEIAADETTVLE